jgi:hypothetical protein
LVVDTTRLALTDRQALKKDGKVLANVPAQITHRAAGGWIVSAQIPIPTNATLGTYVVEHEVQVGRSYDTDESVFVVEP